MSTDLTTTEATLPTYRTIAGVLERKTGSGWKLAGWTALRTLMIAPPMRLVGVPWKKAFAGAAVASITISLFAILRIYAAQNNALMGYLKNRPRRSKAPRGMKRIA